MGIQKSIQRYDVSSYNSEVYRDTLEKNANILEQTDAGREACVSKRTDVEESQLKLGHTAHNRPLRMAMPIGRWRPTTAPTLLDSPEETVLSGPCR